MSYLPQDPTVLSNFINGEFTPSVNGQYLDRHAPATDQVIGKVPDSNAVDIDKAVAAAKSAQLEWKKLTPKERSNYLTRIADEIERMEKESQHFSKLESMDTGKPLQLAASLDIPRAVDNFRFFSSLIMHTKTDAYLSGGHLSADPNDTTNTACVNYVQRFPIGVVGLISPWNLPLYLLTWKIAPALAAGNCIVAKPSELSPFTATALAEVCQRILPKGVVNIVHGYGRTAGESLVVHPDVKMISFTGGSVTGSHVGSLCGKLFKRVSLELGGKNTAVVFSDCDMENTVKTVVRSAFTNQGQICLANSRIIVQEDIYDEFVTKLVEETKKIQPGDPYTSNFGAVISKPHMEKALGYVNQAIEGGGVLLIGGKRAELPEPFNNGYFIEPTLISNVSPSSAISLEEVFAPVVVVMKFRDEQEALDIVNNVQYGLAGCVFTSDIKRGHRFAQMVETGMIWVNCWMVRELNAPFGGVKHSGNGYEGGEHSLDIYSYTKNICIKL